MKHIAQRRTIAAVAAVVVAGLALVGCSSTAATPAKQKHVTLEVWSNIPGAVQAAKKYNASQKNVTVNVDNPPNGTQKLATVLKAGTGAPDAALIPYTNLPQIVATGDIADLSHYGFASSKSDYLPWTWGLVTDGSHIYGVPQDTGPTALVYNKPLLAKYGITPPETWDEFASDAAKLKQASGGTVTMANIPGTYADWFLGLEWQAGGRPWIRNSDGTYTQQLNNSAAEKVATLWQGMLSKGEVSTYPAFSTDLWNALAKGNIATSIEAAWGAGGWSQNVPASTKGVWRVADLPQWSGSSSFAAGDAGGSTFVIPKQGKHITQAIAFAKWLTASNTGASTQYEVSGTFSASDAGQTLSAFKDSTVNPSSFFGGQNIESVFAKASAGVNHNFVYAPWYPAASDAYNAAFSAALSGKTTINQALDVWQSTTLAQAKSQGYKVKTK